MINNFKQIENLLQFKEEGDFFFIQILKRRKDNPGMEQDMILINNYFVYSFEDYYRKEKIIIDECNYHNARAYIRVNKRNTKKVAFQTLKKVTDCIMNGDYHAVKNCYLSAAGEFHSQEPKRWIVDIDVVNGKAYTVQELSEMDNYIKWINECEPVGPKVLDIIQTKNGYHLITTPFNLQIWRKLIKCPIDIHKDNPTILYIP